MINVYIHENITENTVRKLFHFTKGISNTISLARYYHGQFSKEEEEAIQNEYRDNILKEDRERRLRYADSATGYKELLSRQMDIMSEDAAAAYFDKLLERDIMSVDHFIVMGGKMPRFARRGRDYLYTRYTRISPMTRGPVLELCYFDINLFDLEQIIQRRLFAYPIYLNRTAFEDIVFYGEGRIILATCAHKHLACMKLKKQEYIKFCELNICHNIND